MQEALPPDMPAHWVYQFFPDVWPKARSQALSLHSIYTALQAAGFEPQVKRHIWHQPVRLGAALAIAQERPALLGQLSEKDFDYGFQRLQARIEKDGADTLVGSEVALVEIWAQKKAGPVHL